jgi:superfamily II DNA or RNA helicase
MNKLLEYQIEHTNNIKKTMQTYGRALDASDTGTGKTYTSIALCIELGLKPLIICPKSVLTNWKHVLDHFGAKYYGISNYESIHNCRYFTSESPDNKITCNFIKRIRTNHKSDDENDFSSKEAEIFSKRKVRNFTYQWQNIPDDFILIFDEAHRCKNKKTLNSVLLYTAADIDTMKILMLSATISDKPEKFAIAGYVLKLYSNIRNAKSWINNANTGYDYPMIGVHKIIFNEYGSRMKIKELGILFPKNDIIAECYDMDNAEEIERQYEIIEMEVERLQNKEDNSGCALSRILYARMRIEQLKIPTFIELAKKFITDGFAVAIFVNFSMTLQTIADELQTQCVIWGEQTMEERNKNINDFNTDKSHIIICNIRSGGVGISLHDIIGNYARVSIISPSYSAQDIIQVLGRIHRANGKTPVSQRILFCKKTIEEKICNNMKEKIKNISSLNDGFTNTYKINGLIDETDNIGIEKETTEIDRIINKITVLNLKKERLRNDLINVDNELKSLETMLNIICI